ncbi:MAG: arsenate reductase ArsC [Syntrophorhabdus sp.]
MKKIKILFLCTGNSIRSQMAEGWANYLFPDKFEAYSAGTAPTGIDPKALKAMAEAGVDISGQYSKSVDDLTGKDFDYVVTLCDDAQQACPFFPAKTAIIHHSFEDPIRLAADAKSEEEAMHHYRRIRDEMRRYIEECPLARNNVDDVHP